MSADTRDVVAPPKREYDLTREDAIEALYRDANPDIVLHLAAVVGGIGANRENPGKVSLRESHHGDASDGARPATTSVEKFRGRGDHLLLS